MKVEGFNFFSILYAKSFEDGAFFLELALFSLTKNKYYLLKI